MTDATCPTEDDLRRLAAGNPGADAERLRAHLAQCPGCTRTFEALAEAELGATARSPSGGPATESPLGQVGRYVVLRKLGAGAMGQVLEAFDPQLERKIALKMLLGVATDELRQRLLREAQGAARVRHPNVVSVHDSGVVGDQVYVAMELVPGGSLGWWLREGERAWSDVVRVFVGAGRGLAAVHAAGLVHRDFKPDNVLLEENGTARVSDFGLVGAIALEGAPSAEAPPAHDSDGRWQLTRTGMLMGTPAYMAPELFAGGAGEPASDQFAFCVSLYEALQGQLPFTASSVRELADVVRAGNPRPERRAVPTWLSRLVRRGLCADPAKRYPSMDALVAELEALPRRRRRRVVIAVASAAALALGATAVTATRWASGPDCGAFAAQAQSLWDQGGLRARVHAALPADESLFAKAFEDWATTATSRCEAFAKGEVSHEAWGVEQGCLAVTLEDVELAARMAAQGSADGREVLGKSAGTGGACATMRGFRRRQPLPAEADKREQAATLLQQSLAVTDLMQKDLDGAEQQARRVVAATAALGYRPAEARALVALGSVLSNRGDHQSALEAYQQATTRAEEASDDRLLATAYLLKAFTECHELHDSRSCRVSLDLVRAQLDRVPAPEMERFYEDLHVTWLLGTLQVDKAVKAIQAHLPAPGAPGRAAARTMLFDALSADGRFEEAAQWLVKTASDPDLAKDDSYPVSLAMSHIALGELDAAEKQVAAIGAAIAQGEMDPVMAPDVLSLRAQIASARGDGRTAAALFEQMVEVAPDQGQDPQHVAQLLEEGLVTEAKAYERSIEMLHPRWRSRPVDERALTDLLALALIQRATGRVDEARSTLEWLERSIIDLAGSQAWALADVLRTRCLLELDVGALKDAASCLSRLEALDVTRPGRRGPQHALPLPMLQAELALREGRAGDALKVLDGHAATLRAQGHGGALVSIVLALDGEAHGPPTGCAHLKEGLKGLARAPGFFGVDRARLAAAAKRCR
ncbi:MAG: protein kinase [Myxococcales bacterium]|nr:protein kinase [Myxococcales bacterium]